jgi:hypothetical protein
MHSFGDNANDWMHIFLNRDIFPTNTKVVLLTANKIPVEIFNNKIMTAW